MDAERDGLWAVVHCFNQKFIGRIIGIRNDDPKPGPLNKDIVLGSDWVCLSPVYEYFSPMRPVQVPGPGGQPMMAMTRDQFATPFENTAHPTTHWVRMSGIDFFEDMSTEDQGMFNALIEHVNKQQLEARAKRSGLTLSTEFTGIAKSARG